MYGVVIQNILILDGSPLLLYRYNINSTLFKNKIRHLKINIVYCFFFLSTATHLSQDNKCSEMITNALTIFSNFREPSNLKQHKNQTPNNIIEVTMSWRINIDPV